MKWELHSLYSKSEEFFADLEAIKILRELYYKEIKVSVREAILALQESDKMLKECCSFVDCLLAQDPNDSLAHEKNDTVSKENSLHEAALFSLGFFLKSMADEDFLSLLQDEKLKEIAFFLTEQRSIAQKKGALVEENLITALSKDGYHNCWNLYQTLVSQIKIDGLSIGQAENLLSHPDRKIRIETFKKWNDAWQSQETLIAQILNQIGGFRLAVYQQRNWNDLIFEPLFLNRMKKQTLDAMWEAVASSKGQLQQYLQHKAGILGVQKLSWVDLEAPLSLKKASVEYKQAWQLILKHFENFHPRMRAFAEDALNRSWVEAEDRPGKAPGGFCVFFPVKRQSRIFMTYTGTMCNVATLAHELGHGYHNVCIQPLPHFSQKLSMNVAETASTFAENFIMNQLIEGAKDEEEKKALIDDKLQRCVAYFMNLQARFLFEKAFYEARREGFVSAEQLKEMMTQAQKMVFGDLLSDYAPYFWASKLHFYYTQFPFYNFPYTFGYLLSQALLARAHEENFPKKLDDFLADTGKMMVEDLVQKHLGADITKPDFWKGAMSFLEADVQEFLKS